MVEPLEEQLEEPSQQLSLSSSSPASATEENNRLPFKNKWESPPWTTTRTTAPLSSSPNLNKHNNPPMDNPTLKTQDTTANLPMDSLPTDSLSSRLSSQTLEMMERFYF